MSAENLVMELREAAEQVQMEASRNHAVARPQAGSTSPPLVSAEDMIMELRWPTNLLQGLAAQALTKESSGLGGS